ncbi:MAG: cytochrome c biogenesis protein CcdA [Patescibacteria group bacterium]
MEWSRFFNLKLPHGFRSNVGALALGLATLLLVNVKITLAEEAATLYYNKACGDCQIYVEQELVPALAESGIVLEIKDYLNEPKYRTELYAKNQELEVPTDLQDNLTVFFPNGLITEGHVPLELIKEALQPENRSKYDKLILYQPEMHKDIKSYKIQKNDYAVRDMRMSDSLSSVLSEKLLWNIKADSKKSVLYLTIIGGLANSIHPCSIAVLLLLLGFLYSIKQSPKRILLLGFTFILGVFLVYLGIGFGILKAVRISSNPFFAAEVAAIGLAVLGLINIKDVFWPHLPIHIRMPSFTDKVYDLVATKATVPLTLLLGAAVGLCAFPCTGGIYTAIITTLATTKQLSFVLYLFLYNFLFISPLILITALSGNEKVFERFLDFQAKNSRRARFLIGLAMVAIALLVWLWLGSMR